MIKQLSEQWLAAKNLEDEANKQRLAIEIELYKLAMEKTSISKDGTTTINDSGLKLKITSRLNVSVNQEMAKHAPELFVTEFKYSKTHLKSLSSDDQDRIHDFITIKPGKPTFNIEKIENE